MTPAASAFGGGDEGTTGEGQIEDDDGGFGGEGGEISTVSLFGDIHPDWNLSLLLAEDPSHHSEPGAGTGAARSIFLATDALGRGDLILCLLCPRLLPPSRTSTGEEHGEDDDGNHSVLRLYGLRTGPSDARRPPPDGVGGGGGLVVASVSPLPSGDVPCLSAAPVSSSPIPPPPRGSDARRLRLPTRRPRRSTAGAPLARDVMICRSVPGGGGGGRRATSLGLYRADVRVADCALPSPRGEGIEAGGRGGQGEGDPPRIVAVENPVGRRLDLVYRYDDPDASSAPGRGGGEGVIRAEASLRLHSSAVSEAALSAVESALCCCRDNPTTGADPDRISGDPRPPTAALPSTLALAIRSDCVRLTQTIAAHNAMEESEESGTALVDDIGWTATASVLYRVFDRVLSLLGNDSPAFNAVSGSSEASLNGNDGSTSAWETLLSSDFHSSYMHYHGHSLLLQNGARPCGGRAKVAGRDKSKRERALKEMLIDMGLSSLDCLAGRKPHQIAALGRQIFDSLHLLYEDAKLSRSSRGWAWLRLLGSLLVKLCARVGYFYPLVDGEDDSARTASYLIMADFLDNYCRDLGNDWFQKQMDDEWPLSPTSSLQDPADIRKYATSFAVPPCIYSWLDGIMQGYHRESDRNHSNFYVSCKRDKLNGACSSTGMIHRFFSILFDDETSKGTSDIRSQSDLTSDEMDCGTSSDSAMWVYRKRDRNLVCAMIEEGISHSSILINELPSGVSLPLLEALHRCRLDPPLSLSVGSWPTSAYILIGRTDLAEMLSITSKEGRRRFSSLGYSPQYNTPQDNLDPDRDGLVSLESYSSMLFPNDNRIHEAVRLLRSSRPSFLRVPRAPEVSDHDFERLKQERLLLLCRRVLALSLGRGMATIGTLNPVPAESLPMPDLCLSGRVPPTDATLVLDVSNCPSDMAVWPEFHNGAAAGLRLPLAGEGRDDSSLRQITRTWIVYNKPSAAPQPQQNNSNAGSNASDGRNGPNHAHGGFLMALGLRGHLAALAMTDIYDYLTQASLTTTIGILLGMAANKRGSCNPSVSKMLCLHLPSLLPPSFAAMDVASTVQSAAVAGIGLLYQGSSHRLMTEFLLNELGKRPTNDQSTQDRQGYNLSCGLALGMVTLSVGESGSGDKKSSDGGGYGLSDLRIEERLHRYIVGGTDDEDVRRRREAAERANASGNANSGEHERCSCIFEGDHVNTDVTAPGATLALGLMYLRTG